MKNHLICFCIFILSGCVSTQTNNSLQSNTDQTALHSIQSKQLRVLMRELNDLMFERMLNEIQIDRQRRYHTKEIVDVADNLLHTIKYIPNALADLSLEKEEQKVFLGLNEKLKHQVLLLKQEAENNHVDAIPDRADQIIETCNACHHVFRHSKPQ